LSYEFVNAQSDIAIDVILGGLPFEQEAVERVRAHRVGDITVSRSKYQKSF
jgi:hypothetical protein